MFEYFRIFWYMGHYTGLRHSEQGSTLDPNIDSDGELSVNKQPAAQSAAAPQQPAQQPAQQQVGTEN